ncbi:MAG TPA: carboxypeptidase regulatory-like domain-containing protein [Vicinamibacteria bacterium]|nr:carboxypeptidase regulatory-like domain-containing protein [Vicinamibacteria bacterium]
MRFNPFRGMATAVALVAVPLLAVLLALPDTTYAQSITGSLSGSVVDESGGVIPGADVTVTNEASKGVRRSVTNSDGFFAFASLPAATYSVQVSIAGFNTYQVTGIELRSGDSRSLRQIALKVATVAETVSVSAEVALTPLNSGEKSATLSAEQIENIPIVGTSAAEVLRLLPGMSPATNGTTNRPNFTGEVYGINGNGEYQGGGGNNQSAVGNYAANGNRTWALDITIDGAPGADPGCNCATSVNPNTEMVQEFKVLQSNFSAEHAKGPVAMSVISKAGGREFHGSVFGYFRDYHLNSNEWYANKVGQDRVKNKFTYPGFTVSGPLLIPGTDFNKNRDKVFFFAGFEYFGQRLDTGYVKSWVPTAAMRNGDFTNPGAVGSGSFVNTPINLPGGIVPASQMDPGGKALMALYPNPNADPAVTGGYNYINNLLVDQNGWQGLARIDWNISDNTKMFLRYNIQREVQPFVIGLWWRNGSYQLPYPSSISGKNRSDSVSASLTHVFDPTLTNETIFAVTYINFPNQWDNKQAISRAALGYPYQGVYGESNDQIPSVDAGGWGANGPLIFNPGGFDPILFAKKWQISAQDNLTKVWGLHTVKMGAYFEHVTNAQPNNANSNAYLALATWEGGSTGNTFADLLRGGPLDYSESSKNLVNDMHYNLLEGYIQDSWKVKPRLTLDLGVRLSYFGPWTDNAGIGMAAWDATKYGSGTGSYPGIVWNKIDSNVPLSGVDGSWFYATPRFGFAWDLRGTGETVVRGGVGMYRYHEPQSIYSSLLSVGQGQRSYSQSDTYIRNVEGLGGGALPGASNTIDINDNKMPLSYTWSLTLNQKLPWSMNVELGYVGNKNDNLLNNGIANYNAVPLGAMLSNPSGNQQLYRPLQAYGDLNVYQHDAYSNYHSLQALLSRQRGSFNYTLSYTFSKSLGIRTSEVGNSWGSEYIVPLRSYYYGVSGQDRTHVASASFSWLLKEFKGDPVLNAFLGGWQIAGVATYVSGAPLQLSNGVNFNIQGTNAQGVTINPVNITGSPQMAAFPVLTCDPTKNVPSGYMINPSCFAAPSVGQNGNYVMPYMKGNAYQNLDMSLFKNFSVGSKGQKVQLRISGYNVLNHPIWYPDQSANLTLNYTNGVQTNANFGKINEDNKFGRRIVQLALRFTF